MELNKTFNPADIEQRVSRRWDAAEVSGIGLKQRKHGGSPFSVLLPPPNITGNLHLGHAVNLTIQDILVRWKRMQGFDVLWQPGVDHAGIATQLVVERELSKAGKPTRNELGRAAFLKEVWAWKDRLNKNIREQLKRLGSSCNWSRERFTMDDGFSKVVTKVFVDLYKRDLIYRDRRIVNWDPHLNTAISDLEVVQVEVDGKLWHFNYPIQGETSKFITVSTTRPETMLGDTAVAVNPTDTRYKHLIGRRAVLPIVGRSIPIIADTCVNPSQGYGAVKVTPAHDANDFGIGRRHGLREISIFDHDAKISLEGNVAFWDELWTDGTQNVLDDGFSHIGYVLDARGLIENFHGTDRFIAREKVISIMDRYGLFVGLDNITHAVPHGDRSNAIIEPLLMDQWYVKVAALVDSAISAVKNSETRLVPKTLEAGYFQWLANVQPWCVSRQLWWGHRIPAWYNCEDNDKKVFFVEETATAAQLAAERYYGKSVQLKQDDDVLDTWFSSALWPLVTLGWPDDEADFLRYYPVSVLVTAFDIVFFWVARMMMIGIHLTGRAPFNDVYVHGLVRDSKGAKMSKSKGNVIDPMSIVDRYGADSLRFSLSAMACHSKDLRLSMEHVEGGKAFATKLWNAARFVSTSGCISLPDFNPDKIAERANRWVLTKLSGTIQTINESLSAYKVNEASSCIYRFAWNMFCDWYVELVKSVLKVGNGGQQRETRAVCGYVFDEVLKLAHPFMPFITEELWDKLSAVTGIVRGDMLFLTEWPSLSYESNNSVVEIDSLIRLISDIRSVRAEMNVAPSSLIPVVVSGAGDSLEKLLISEQHFVQRLARISTISFSSEAPTLSSAQVEFGCGTVYLFLSGITDLLVERLRLEKEKSNLELLISRIDAKLSVEGFLEKAKREVIDKVKGEREQLLVRRDKLSNVLEKLGCS